MKKLLYLLTIVTAFNGCKVNGTWKDENIDARTRNEIRKLNDQVIEGISENKPEKIYAICADDVLQLFKRSMDELIQNEGSDFTKERYKIKNEFYQVNSVIGGTADVITGMSGEHDFKINYKVITNKTFITVGYFDFERNTNSFICLYGKFKEGWRLYACNIGVLEILHKDAYDWYLISKDYYNKGYIVDASNAMKWAYTCLKPIGDKGAWQYVKEKEILDFSKKLQSEIFQKYSFPMYIDNIETRPSIFTIYPEVFKGERMIPIVQYVSTIPLTDTTKLSIECDKIHSQIGTLYKGLDLNNEVIFYQAFERIPVGQEKLKCYGFSRKTNA